MTLSQAMGYSGEDLERVPEGANLGLGCGNPVALASLKKGQTALDLGSGAGFDSFLAANQVGESGKIIGVDMTADGVDYPSHRLGGNLQAFDDFSGQRIIDDQIDGY